MCRPVHEVGTDRALRAFILIYVFVYTYTITTSCMSLELMHFSMQPHSVKVQPPYSVFMFSFYTCIKRISSTCNCSLAFHPCGIFSGSFISCLESKFNSQDTGTKIERNTKGWEWQRKWGEDGRADGGGRRTREEILKKSEGGETWLRAELNGVGHIWTVNTIHFTFIMRLYAALLI